MSKVSMFRNYLNEKLKDPEFKKLWDASESEYATVIAEMKAQIAAEEQAKKILALPKTASVKEIEAIMGATA